MWRVFIPDKSKKVEADDISMDFRINAVSNATISFYDSLTRSDWVELINLFGVNQNVKIKYNNEVYFNGYVHDIKSSKMQKGYNLQVTLFDPLGKLIKIPIKGGVSKPLNVLLQYDVCNHIGITNAINDTTQINLYYETEVSRYALMLDACTIARYLSNDPSKFGFYYNHKHNSLCKIDDENYHISNLKSISTENRLAISYSYGNIVANRVYVTNIK